MQTSSRPRPLPLSTPPLLPLPLPMTQRSPDGRSGVPGSIPTAAAAKLRSSSSISSSNFALSSLISVPAAQHTLSSRIASRDSSRRFGRISRSLRAPSFGTSAARGTYRPFVETPRSRSREATRSRKPFDFEKRSVSASNAPCTSFTVCVSGSSQLAHSAVKTRSTSAGGIANDSSPPATTHVLALASADLSAADA